MIGGGRPSPAPAQEAAAARGYDLSAHRSQLVSRAQAHAAGLVVVMNAAQRAGFRARFGAVSPVLVLGDLDPQPILRREIADPINRGVSDFARVYERIDRCTERLAVLLGTRTDKRRS